MRGETSDVRVCGELPIFDTNQHPSGAPASRSREFGNALAQQETKMHPLIG